MLTYKLVYDRKKIGGKSGLLQFQLYDPYTKCRKYIKVMTIPAISWNTRTNCIIQRNLSELEAETLRAATAKLESILLEGSRSGKRFTLEWLLDNYKDKAARGSFLDYMQTYIDKIPVKNTRLSYVNSLITLKGFRAKVLFSDIDAAFVDKFLEHCKHFADTTKVKHFSHFVRVWNVAVGAGVYDGRNYWSFAKPTAKPTEKVKYLNYDAVLKMERFVCEGKLNVSKDMFLFSCYTGLRYGDVANLTSSDFFKDTEGATWLCLKQQKTRNELRFCLSDFLDGAPLEILKRYDMGVGRIFPVMSYATCRVSLHAIFKRLGLDEDLGFHSSRHTFAMLLYNDANLPLETVSYLLGHTSIKTTKIYAKMKEQKLRNMTKGVRLSGGNTTLQSLRIGSPAPSV